MTNLEAMELRVAAAKAICTRGYTPAQAFGVLGWGCQGKYTEEYACVCEWYAEWSGVGHAA